MKLEIIQIQKKQKKPESTSLTCDMDHKTTITSWKKKLKKL